MSFSLRNLSVLAYSNGFTLWLYRATLEDRSSLVSAGFFDDAGDMLAEGDMILVSTVQGGLLLSVLADGSNMKVLPVNEGDSGQASHQPSICS